MIIVTVDLVSAVTGQTKQLARMHICNDGTGTKSVGDYDVTTFRGRDAEALERRASSRTGRVEGYPRTSLHVWNLVSRALAACGYR
jgi:hypothetical protein